MGYSTSILRGKYLVMDTYTKEEEIFQMNNLILYLKELHNSEVAEGRK